MSGAGGRKTSRAVQWLTLPPSADGVGSIPVCRAKAACTSRPKENKQQNQSCNTFNKDFKNGLHQKQIFKEK